MPWQTPTLAELRALNRNNITARLNSGAMIPNSVLRVMSDANAGLAFLTLMYLNWISKQLLPDTAETTFLDRFADIWLAKFGGGRKTATYASGSVLVTGIAGTVLPLGMQFSGQGAPSTSSSAPVTVLYQSTAQVTIGSAPTPVNLTALTAGAAGNLDPGTIITFSTAIAGANGIVTVVSMTGGADQESDDLLRARVLQRIQQPPMGGAATDYVAWAESIPGVTRAWCSPGEMGIGTVTLRFMMDQLRATPGNYLTSGFPNATDVAAVQAYVNSVRPVTAIDVFVEAPIPEPINFVLGNLSPSDAGTVQNIVTSVNNLLLLKGAPANAVDGTSQLGQTIYQAWISDAVYQAAGVNFFDLVMADHSMPTNGSLAVLGNIVLGPATDFSTPLGSQYVPLTNV
jgi:uncharacterized phage protein gp47/JayE